MKVQAVQRVGIVAALAASTLLLAACSNPLQAAKDAVSTAAANAVEDATSVKVAVGSLPADWPADIPVVSGDIVTSLGENGSWQVVIKASDLKKDFASAKDKLLAAGFAEDFYNDDNDVFTGQYSNGKYTIQLIGGAPDFPGLAYIVTATQ